jgi:hypothetical protein
MRARVRGAPTVFARIGLLNALHRNNVREFKPSEKKTHWGKRKLARDRQRLFRLIGDTLARAAVHA